MEVFADNLTPSIAGHNRIGSNVKDEMNNEREIVIYCRHITMARLDVTAKVINMH